MTYVTKVRFLAHKSPPLDPDCPQSATSRPVLKLMDPEPSTVLTRMYSSKKGNMIEKRVEKESNENIEWKRQVK
jgi:hypothetical protein